jgi:hypothetical protein
MEKYLLVITTILVATQIIRLIQNAIQLRRMNKQLESTQNKQIVRLWDKLEEAIDKYMESEGE